MTVKQIKKIRDFGIFKKFDWNVETPDFTSFNLAYGWNYCGKTTLSRIFRCFELGSKHIDYESAKFEIEDLDGKKYTELSFPTKLPIRVFNTDFITDNLKWNEGIEPIFMLGEINIRLQSQLDLEKANMVQITKKLEIEQDKLKVLDDRIYWSLSNKAGEIKNTLVLITFDKRHFEQLVLEVLNDTTTVLLSDSEVEKYLEIYKSTEKKSVLGSINITLPDILKLCDETNQLLIITVTAKVIEKLKKNPRLNEWVKEGKELHKGLVDCEFCGNHLPNNLLEDLNKHFSDDYNRLLTNLSNKITAIEQAKINFIFPDSANFYNELQNEYADLRESAGVEISFLNKNLQILSTTLDKKRTAVFEKMSFPSITSNIISINENIGKINELITRHNFKTTQFDIQKTDAYKKLTKNYAIDFARKQNYENLLSAKDTITLEILAIELEIEQINSRINGIEKSLSETVKGAEKVNEYLGLYFGKNDIIVEVTKENKFKLLRSGKIANNLSEGEKTAIAFAYFISRLEDKNTTLVDTVIYLDDPISSLDSNHLFNTYSFIRTKLYDEMSRTLKCKQLFVSTHNFEFFNLIKDWYKKIGKKHKSFYLVERITNDSSDESNIIQLPLLLLKFKSEYAYLFSLIYKFKETPTKEFEQLYNLPNIIRRFLETFTAFKYLSSKNVDENLHFLITDGTNCERVRKFIHYHSHSISTNRMMQFSDLRECTDIVDIVLGAIKDKDLDHHDSLVDELTLSISEFEGG